MRRLVCFAAPFALGTAACQYLLPEEWRVAAAAAAALAGALAVLLAGKRRKRAAAAAAGLLLGVCWFTLYASWFLTPNERLSGTEDAVSVTLADYAQRTGTGVRCEVRSAAFRGRAMLYGDAFLLDLAPGDTVRARVKYYSAVDAGGERSSYFTSRGVFLRMYVQGEPLDVEKNAPSLRYLPRRLARGLKDAVKELYGQPERGLILSMLTGDRDELDDQSRSDLSRAGLMHVTAVSGLHCGFLIALAGLLAFRRQRLTALLGCPVLLLYALAVGATPSVTRSCVMLGFFLLSPLLGREGDGPTSLAAALLVILLADPFAVASVSLQLSFGAVAGLIAFHGRLSRALSAPARRMGRLAGGAWRAAASAASASLSAMVFTAPLTALYFGSVSLLSPLSSLLALWAAPALFASALLLSPLAAAVPALSPLAVLPALLARYMLACAGLVSRVPGSRFLISGAASALWLAFVCVLPAACLAAGARRRTRLLAAALALLTLPAARAAEALPVRGAELAAVAVDVGQGAAALLHASGCTALVDCGSLSVSDPERAVEAAMDRYGWEKLDHVILTHYHEDHAGGLSRLLASVEADDLLLPRLSDGGQASLQAQTLALAEARGVPAVFVEDVLEIPLGDASLTLYPPLRGGGANEEGLTVLCSAGDFDVLITGDMSASTERLLTETYALPDVEVLFVGHHGSGYATSEELLSAVSPEIGLVSVGYNSFGHPGRETLERCAAAGMTLYRTDAQGDITVVSYGDGAEVVP